MGSSSSSRSGSPVSARASDPRVSSPPEKVESWRSRSSSCEAQPAHGDQRPVAPAVAAVQVEALLRLRRRRPAWRRRGRRRPSPAPAGRAPASSATTSAAPDSTYSRRLRPRSRGGRWSCSATGALPERQVALVDRRLAREHPQQRGLARAVAPGQRHPVAALELERHAAQQGAAGDVLPELGGDHDGHAPMLTADCRRVLGLLLP